jgi:hypothetical protein
MTLPYFSELLPQLAKRAKHASMSRLGFANVPLRRHLAEVFSKPYGEAGSFLADPTFEAVFGWKAADPSMQELAGNLLTSALVDAMDTPPKEFEGDYRFARDQRPYVHQLQAWKILAKPIPQSIVIASGTGSGKTECFMVPILNRLTRLHEEKRGRLIGVRALFLYPLNALINSQRDRLRAWTQAFDGDIRFCLYNGNTPDQVPSREQQTHPNEILDRDTLRASPPPILVTNATMLEYMLVRTVDKPILDQSQGRLEWVVLDEAHTYVGSQAAEVALLIRRVLSAFGVQSEQVRFVATSATIGDPNGEAGQRLKRFLAQVAGICEDRIHLVAGERSVPRLPEIIPKGTESIETLWKLDNGKETSPTRYDALANHRIARKVREFFVGNREKPPVARLSEICDVIHGPGKSHSQEAQHTALSWLDLVSGTRDNTGDKTNTGTPFLPLRAHLFHQTLSGLWACADPSCSEKKESKLDDPLWPYGQLFLEPRKHCSCGSPAYEVTTCGDCGTVYLLASISKEFLTHLMAPGAIDEFELEIEADEVSDEPDEDEQQESISGHQSRVLIVNHNLPYIGELSVERHSRKITEPDDNTLRLLASQEDSNGLTCPACGECEAPRERLFQVSRIGAPFLLGGILPTLLEYAPDGERPADHPYRGRRLLTFNDSRQGTARMAAKLQQDAERNRVRGLVYHLALQCGQDQANDNAKKLHHEIQTLKQVLESAQTEALIELITQKEADLSRLAQPAPISFNDLAQKLTGQGQDFERMLEYYRRVSPDSFGSTNGPLELAYMFLVREFGRRPKRQNNLETMGLVAVRYPDLDKIRDVPAGVMQAASFSLNDWCDFLKLSMDFFVRSGGSLDIPVAWRNWLGMPFPQTRIVCRDERDVSRNQRRWPRATRSRQQSTLVRLLAYVLKADIETAHGEDRVDIILLEVWKTLLATGLLKMTNDGYVLSRDRVAFSPMDHAWICPFTRRFLDTTLQGISPYLPLNTTNETALCERVELPLYDKPFSGVTDDLDRIQLARDWLMEKSEIHELRAQGLWSDLNDRTVELTPFLTAAEHSAQQDSKTLQQYERRFKAGDLNLLSCSTTMEMGIDIGGISMVAMNNVPPHPANYLQRAGRAGRRREARSVSMTLCKSNPHDQAVYSNSRWAFDTPLPAPHVSLDSPVIVQRHVNAFLLTHFLAEQVDASGQDKSKLTCGWFFTTTNPPAEYFAAWCRDFNPTKSRRIMEGLRQLIRHSVFESYDAAQLASGAADFLDSVGSTWVGEWQALSIQEKEFTTSRENDPAYRAVQLRKERMEGEYLLRELATQGFLPGYGFPTHITSFDNLTVKQFKRMRQDKESGREDNRYHRRELASRDRITALREYAPGSEVVMDGLVYRSAGITLNWHIPANQQDAREIQNIRFVWRCHHCGASGSGHNLKDSWNCHECGKEVRADDKREFLEPAGFAVDFYKDPDNDVTTQHFVPVEAPWISAQGDWHPLPNPALGRFRTTTRGHLFHQSRGINGEGYALCLACGRAEPMVSDQHLPPAFQNRHSKLRGARAGDMTCPGSHDVWKIKADLTLGHEAYTDVMELQLKTENGMWVKDRTKALTLAVALRDSIAELLGVRATELGCDVKEAKPEAGAKCQSILIYDHFAAGYASGAGRLLNKAFALARKNLECSANCDSVCPQCVLDFDQRFAADSLDRGMALEVLTDNWLNILKLPNELAYFGSTSHPEYTRLSEAIWRNSNRDGVNQVRLFGGGPGEEWDIGPSPLRHLAYRLAGREREVTIVVPHSSIESADSADLILLASMADHPRIKVSVATEMPFVKNGTVLAEIVGKNDSTRWATSDAKAGIFNMNWAKTASPLVVGNNLLPLSLNEKSASVAELYPRSSSSGDRLIELHHQLNGPLTGFGIRFWEMLADHHSGAKELLLNSDADVLSIRYQDRYLFTPLSLALLIELIEGLRDQAGRHRWANPQVTITTSEQRTAGESTSRPTVWSDWPDAQTRNEALTHALQYVGIDLDLQVASRAATPHARMLEVKFQSDARLIVQFDQGVSYWRAVESRQQARSASMFDFSLDPENQGREVAEMKLDVAGALHPTQIFVVAR